MDAAWGDNDWTPTIKSDVLELEPLNPVVSFSGVVSSGSSSFVVAPGN